MTIDAIQYFEIIRDTILTNGARQKINVLHRHPYSAGVYGIVEERDVLPERFRQIAFQTIRYAGMH